MKKHGIGSRLLALLLALAMVLPMVPLTAKAAVGDLSNVDTGLTGDIDTEDIISLPIQILDYESDGMLFEYAESVEIKDAADFGATWAADFASQTAIGNVTNSMYGDFWGYTTKTLDTSNAYASFMRVTWADNSAQAPHTVYGRSGTIMPNDLGGLAMDSVRYLILVYRSKIANGKIGFFVERANADRNNTNNRVGDFSLPATGDNWSYAVYDLKQGNLANTWTSYGGANAVWTTLPMDSSDEYMDIAHVALFANKEQAEAFGEYAITDGSNRGDNRAFGLLRSSRNQNGTDAFAGVIDKTRTVEHLMTYNVSADNNPIDSTTAVNLASIDYSTLNNKGYYYGNYYCEDGLGYTLLGTFKDNGIANVGLLESTLVNGKPVYKQEVVAYLAQLLEHSLGIEERTNDGWKNYRYIGSDLANELRSRITGGLGTYPTGDAAKGLIGTWEQCQGNIHTYYDAAYFLLNNLFHDSSYNTPQDTIYEVDANGDVVLDENGDPVIAEKRETYDYLVLSAGTDSATGDKVYVFDGGFSTSSDPENADMAIDYNKTNHTIQNTSAAGKAHFVYSGSSTTTLNPFLPITDMNTVEGQTKSPYYQDDGIINGVKKQEGKDTNYMRDYNFAMYSSGEFVYHADEELFFDFEGDDDVYLFINDELVMDIGSAHSIDGVRIELNDYVEAAKAGQLGSDERNARLALVEGDTYNFDFFYMERHTYGSNMRINTNIKVTDPSMSTEKTAWQNGAELDYGSIIDKDKIVEYGFSITNEGGENLYNIGFADKDIGIILDPKTGLTVTGKRVTDLSGGTLEASDLTAVLYGENRETGLVYDPITVTFADNNALIHFLQDIKSDAAIESGGGLWKGSSVSFRGIGYKLSQEQIEKTYFDNTVLSSATNKTASKTMHGQDTMRVYVPSDPMYYEWAKHDLKVTKAKLIGDILEAAADPNNPLYDTQIKLTTSNVNKIELTTKNGNPITSDYVSVSSSYDLTINYPTVGSKVFYVKITYNNGDSTPLVVPVLVNVTDVADSVFVLDYGLEADLTGSNNKGISELLKNDTLSVPGRDTDYSFLALGSDGAYTPNEITFTDLGETVTVENGNGTFTKGDKSLTYTPSDFMDMEETVQLAVNVYEQGITPSKITGTLDINNEVEMFKDITVLPATVVYYEDDFPAIDYITQTKNSFTRLGESTDESQGVDQEENYGHDDTYADGSNTSMSAGVLTTITIGQEGPVAKFTFKGTGFELISRTNAYDAATLDVAVFKGTAKTVAYENYQYVATDENGKELTRERMIPVINEFDNGGDGGSEEIYQVPVIRVDDLDLDTYTVVIGGVPAYDWEKSVYPDGMVVIPTELYVDGLRIFQPLGPTNDNYTADENGAVFTEIRDLIVVGRAAVATYDGADVTISTGTTTWTENRNGVYYDGSIYEGNVVNSVDDYLLYGPNNEVYMDGAFSDTALYFQVTESGDGTHALQVAIHAVDQGLFYGAGSTGMHAPVYYATAAGSWEKLETITSGVEMYYTIDYTKCPVSNGAYQIILKVDIAGSDLKTAMASYTTIKTVGLEIGSVGGEATELAFVNGVLTDTTTGEAVDPMNYPDFQLLGRMLSTSVMAAPEQPEPVNPFVDAEEGSFYYDAMLWAVENGITNGTSATTFSPDKQVTRAETVTFLWRAAGQPEPTIAKNPFADVSTSDFYYKAVLWAVENGITNGMDAAHFGPYSICNRAQVVTFLWRAAGEPVHSTAENPFADAEEGAYYYDAMLWAVENGITNGIDAAHFGPAANCNRAQIVTFLYRAQ